jgi:DNA polymerase III delta subunit
MLDLALDGKTAAAIRQLNALMLAGEDAAKILPQIAYTLRKLAAATELILDAERRKSKLSVRSALEKAGIKGFVLEKTEKQLIHLGRHRGAKLSKWLLQLDLDLKGDSRSDKRLLLETFIVKLSSAKLRETQ